MTATAEKSSTVAAAAPAAHLYELIQRRARDYPSAIALGSDEGLRWHTVDSRQLLELVDELAAELAADGVQEGDRVITWVPNTWRTAVYLFAIWKLGAIVVPFDREMNPAAAGSIIDSVEPCSIIVGYGEQPEWARDHEPSRVVGAGQQGGFGPQKG